MRDAARSALALLIAAVVGSCGAGDEPARFKPNAFTIYYGRDARTLAQIIERIEAGHVVVIDTREAPPPKLKCLLDTAKRKGARILGYISIGELHSSEEKAFNAFLVRYLEMRRENPPRERTLASIVIGKNEQFRSFHVDAQAEIWRAWVMTGVDQILATGVDGLFLDTVDTVDLYIGKKDWSLDRRIESVERMMNVVRASKARDRTRYILQNRGLNLIGAKVFVGDATGKEIRGLALAAGQKDNPDAVLWEDAFHGDDAWSRGKEAELRAIQKSGKADVFALGYKAVHPKPEDFFKKSAAAGFISAWGTSSDRLHIEAATGR